VVSDPQKMTATPEEHRAGLSVFGLGLAAVGLCLLLAAFGKQKKRSTSNTRRIEGRRYRLYIFRPTKKAAQTLAQNLRKRGHSARVLRLKYKDERGQRWAVFWIP